MTRAPIEPLRLVFESFRKQGFHIIHTREGYLYLHFVLVVCNVFLLSFLLGADALGADLRLSHCCRLRPQTIISRLPS